MLKRYWLVISLITVLMLVASACGPAQPAETTSAPQPSTSAEAPAAAQPAGPKILRLAMGPSDWPTIDPSHSDQSSEIQIIESTSLGLVRQNETTADIEKAFATDYTISPDGKTVTLKLMQNVPWVRYNGHTDKVEQVLDCNGKPRMVKAQDFVYGIMRTLDPKTASEYAYVLLPYLAGAEDYNTGAVTDPAAVGVKAIDDNTIEYTFKESGVYNLNLIGLWVAHAQPAWLIDGDDCTTARGDRWIETGFFESYGPFTMKEWIHDSSMTLAKNPFWPGNATVPQAKIDEVQIRLMDDTAALAEFEAGNLDVTNIPTGDWDRIRTDPSYKDMIGQVYTIGTEWYGFNNAKPPTDDQRVRLALSMAIDRQSLVDNVIKAGVPAPFFTNPGASGAPKPELYPDLGVKYDPVKAKALLDSYLQEKGQTADQLQLTLVLAVNELRKATAEAIVGMWKQNLGLNVNIVTQESKVYLKTRQDGNENIYRASWVQDYPDANNFLYDTFGPNGGFTSVIDWPEVMSSTDTAHKYQAGGNPLYDKFLNLITQAASETDAKKRMDLYSQAEQILVVDQAALTPLYWYTGPILIRPAIQDTTSITGYDHWEKWDIQE